LVGATVLGAPETSTTWNAIAVASHSVQRAAAWALLAWSTTPPRWVEMSQAKSNARPPSCSIVACARFSPVDAYERLYEGRG